jgi:type IV pilus assembly protein PilW
MMPLARRFRRRTPRHAQAGLSMIELLVAVAISLLMLMGLFSIVYGTRQNFLAQNQLGILQDNERMAMTLLTNVIQTAGYFANPQSATQSGALPVDSTNHFTTAGQSIYGTAATTGTSDQISVRYLAGTNDGVMDCQGQTNSSGAAQMDVNTFWVDTVNQQLKCTATDGTAAATTQVLVTNVTNMTVSYGVAAAGTTSAVQYISSANMTAANWASVVSVQVTLTFANPLTGTIAATGGNAANFPPTLTRTIDLLNTV